MAMTAAAMLLAACGSFGTVMEPSPPPQSPVVRVDPGATGAQDPNRFGPGQVRVALLLPLSGPNAAIGTAMQNAAQLALFDVGASEFELLTFDTAGTPQGATSAATEAVSGGARLIIGPLFASSVPAAAQQAETAGINVMAFTTDASVAGGNTLVMGFLPAAEVERVIQFGRSRNLSNYAVLAPDTDYGRLVVNSAQDTARRYGASVVQTGFYDANAAEATSIVRDFANGPRFDAILLPDVGIRLRAVGSLIPYYGLQDTQILGTGIWDGANVGVEQAMRGAWYAAPQPDLRAEFDQRYSQTYGQAPPLISALAYDAVALAARLSQINSNPTYDWQMLTNPSGFAGITGIFRFTPDGLVERGLAVMEVTVARADDVIELPSDDEGPAPAPVQGSSRGALVIDPAPSSFVGFGL